VRDYINGAGSKINWELESEAQPNKKSSNKAAGNRAAAKQKAKCQLAAQGYNNARTKNLLPVSMQRKQS
jgi:hypothetical protein